MSSGGGGCMMNKGGRKHKRPAPLDMAKEEVRQVRRPVITHIYSPEIIHVDAAQFSSIVQSLTGPKSSPRALESKAEDLRISSDRNAKLAYFEHLHRPAGRFEVSRANKPDDVSNKVGTMVSSAVRSACGRPRHPPGFSSAFPSPPLHVFSSIPSTSLILSPKS